MPPHPLYYNIEQTVRSLFKDAPSGPPRLLLVAKKATDKLNGNHVEHLISYLKLLPKITEIFYKYHGCEIGSAVSSSIVTSGDLEITKQVYQYISTHFPDDLIIDEERETTLVDDPKGVIVFDPIDGTKPYAEGKEDCCHVFSRFTITDEKVQDGFSLIWEPINNCITIAVSAEEDVSNMSHTSQEVSSSLRVNVSASSETHQEKLSGVEHLLPTEQDIAFHMIPSASVALRYMTESRTDIFLRRSLKLWDFLPGAFANFLIGHEVFFYDTNKEIFPLSLKKLREVASLKPKSERKLKHLCITRNAEQRCLVTKQ